MKRLKNSFLFRIAIVGIIIFLLSRFLIQLTFIAGDSMSPTFQNGDAALMQHIYDTSQLSYNDVIVIKSNKVNQTIVKRIIGLPGDTVQIINQSVFVNNVLYSEASTFDPIIDSGNASAPIHLSDHEFFVLGDNRNASIDSRFDTIGLIPESSIIGKIIWSFL